MELRRSVLFKDKNGNFKGLVEGNYYSINELKTATKSHYNKTSSLLSAINRGKVFIPDSLGGDKYALVDISEIDSKGILIKRFEVI